MKETGEEKQLHTGQIVKIESLPEEMRRNSSNYLRRLLDEFLKKIKEEEGENGEPSTYTKTR